jgi:hypothetical protein
MRTMVVRMVLEMSPKHPVCAMSRSPCALGGNRRQMKERGGAEGGHLTGRRRRTRMKMEKAQCYASGRESFRDRKENQFQ